MKTLHELKLEHANTTHGELMDFVYAYFIDLLNKKQKEYESLYADYSNHDHTINDLRHTMFHTDAYVQTLQNYLASDSVYTLLRYGSKSPTIVDGMDAKYIDLLNISEQIRAADNADIQNRNDAFDQTLP